MSEWQKVLRDGSVDTLEKLAEKFGHDVIDVEALRPAFDAFQVRITPAALEQIKAVGAPRWNQDVPPDRGPRGPARWPRPRPRIPARAPGRQRRRSPRRSSGADTRG